MILLNPIRVLMLPAMHPYISKLEYDNRIIIINRNTNYFTNNLLSVQFLEEKHKLNNYDIVHIHFSFDKVSTNTLQEIISYFKKNNKPIIWTCHSKESQRVQNYKNGIYQKIMFNASDQIITLTNGCKNWIISQWGNHKNNIDVIPHGLIALPDKVLEITKTITKNPKLFTILFGEFRENKERIKCLIDFIKCKELEECLLQLIYKPINEPDCKKNEFMAFLDIVNNSNRIITFSKPWITNEELIKLFYSSHAIILPYKWGTHSGQIELAKDCGCHIVSSNVGFYKEQWKKVILWNNNDNNYTKSYQQALIKVKNRTSLKPIGKFRYPELVKIIDNHITIYDKCITQIKSIF